METSKLTRDVKFEVGLKFRASFWDTSRYYLVEDIEDGNVLVQYFVENKRQNFRTWTSFENLYLNNELPTRGFVWEVIREFLEYTPDQQGDTDEDI